MPINTVLRAHAGGHEVSAFAEPKSDGEHQLTQFGFDQTRSLVPEVFQLTLPEQNARCLGGLP